MLSQWLTYSFVAVSVKTAGNFSNQVYKPFDWENTYDTLCIINFNQDAAWATANGEEITLLSKSGIKVKQLQLNNKCRQKKTLNFENNGWNFIKQ